jgi:hypothetical protein
MREQAMHRWIIPVAMTSVSAGWLVAGEAKSPGPKVEQVVRAQQAKN